MRWTVIVPVKGGTDGKSRLPATVRGVARARVAAAFAADTVAAVAAATAVARVIVVTATPDVALPDLPKVEVRGQHAAGLNPAIAEVERDVSGPIAVVLGDLPALRPEDVDDALGRAAGLRRAVVADAAGTGTTLLAAADGRLLPAFGARSLSRHRALGSTVLAGSPRLRADVDTERDLDRAESLGLGIHTAELLSLTPIVTLRPAPMAV